MGMKGEINFKIGFLKAMTPSMSLDDLDAFRQVCERLLEGTTSVQDLETLDGLFEKFDKPRGN